MKISGVVGRLIPGPWIARNVQIPAPLYRERELVWSVWFSVAICTWNRIMVLLESLYAARAWGPGVAHGR